MQEEEVIGHAYHIAGNHTINISMNESVGLKSPARWIFAEVLDSMSVLVKVGLVKKSIIL